MTTAASVSLLIVDLAVSASPAFTGSALGSPKTTVESTRLRGGLTVRRAILAGAAGTGAVAFRSSARCLGSGHVVRLPACRGRIVYAMGGVVDCWFRFAPSLGPRSCCWQPDGGDERCAKRLAGPAVQGTHPCRPVRSQASDPAPGQLGSHARAMASKIDCCARRRCRESARGPWGCCVPRCASAQGASRR